MNLLNMAWLIILAYAGTEDDSLLGRFENVLPSTEWEEYEDRSDIWWNFFVNPLEIKYASLFDITAILGINTKDALRLRQSSEIPQHFIPEVRIHNLIARRFGDRSDADEIRYDGSAFGLTQRYWLKLEQVRVGVVLDKDPFEPNITDLSRFWLEWKGSRNRVIIGDFHVTSGHGLGIWTRSAYFNAYDNPRQFRRNGRGITVSNDTAVNSALRGIAFDYNRGRLGFNLYGSKRQMDALVDDDTNNILRLSDGGNHRSSGEREKYNSVTETLTGGFLDYTFSNDYFHEIKLFGGSYISIYDPPFKPGESERTRFPFTGSRFGAIYSGLALATDRFVFRGSASSDFNSNIAWKSGIEYLPTVKSRPHILVDLYNYPVRYQSPRAVSPLNRPNTTGKYGGALLVSGNSKSWLISKWNAHIEIARKPWRSYLIHSPVTESKSSVTVSLNLTSDTEQVIRFRRKTSKSSVAGDIDRHYTEHKIRITEYFEYMNANRISNIRLQLWQEVGRRDHIDGSNYWGGMIGMKINNRIKISSNYLDKLNYTLQIAAFNIEDNLSLYLGEYDIPYRISSVRLSGKGLRLSGGLNFELGKRKWVALKIAQTRRFDDATNNSDLELILSASYVL